MAGILTKKGKLGHSHAHKKGAMRTQRSKGCAWEPGMPKITNKPPEASEKQGTTFPFEKDHMEEGTGPANALTLDGQAVD